MIPIPQCNDVSAGLALTPVSSDNTGLLQVRNAPLVMQPNESCHDDAKSIAVPLPFRSVLAGAASGVLVDKKEQQGHPVAVFGVGCQTFKDFCNILLNDFGVERYATVIGYNSAIGLSCILSDKKKGNHLWEKDFHKFLDNISKIDKYDTQPAPDNLSPNLVAWRRYLFDNKNKLDPIIRIEKLMNHGTKQWQEDTLHQFILKNSPVFINSTKSVSNLKYFIKCLRCSISADLKKALADDKNLNGEFLLTEADYRDLSHIFELHFIRNISKLGLKFFASRGYDIVFSCNVTNDTLIKLDAVRDKPWKRGERRFDNHEPITNSELRCVLRDKSSLFNNDNVYAGMLTEEEIAFSKFLSEEWYGFPFAFDAADDK